MSLTSLETLGLSGGFSTATKEAIRGLHGVTVTPETPEWMTERDLLCVALRDGCCHEQPHEPDQLPDDRASHIRFPVGVTIG